MGKVHATVWLLWSIALVVSSVWLRCTAGNAWNGAAHSRKNEPQIFELSKGNLHINISNWGATIISLLLPDSKGHLADVVLGFDTLAPYMNGSSPYFGAVVGRVANRIKNAQFTLNGITYHLPANDGNNTLHGGIRGFDKVLWNVKEKKLAGRKPFIHFTYHSFDGEQGFPGDLDVSAIYTLCGNMEMRLDLEARPRNKATPVSLINHAYWNLAGHNSGRDILGHSVRIWGSHYTPTDKQLIPTGQILPVKGTPLDFRKEATVGSRIDQVPGGYDHNYVLDVPKYAEGLRPAARAKDPHSCRVVELWTTAPGLQFYTSNTLKRTVGKGGAVYKQRSALCLETQAFPNAVNQPNFPSVIVKPGQIYRHTMLFKFSVDKQQSCSRAGRMAWP